MQVSVEKLNSVSYRLSITIPANIVENAYQKQLNQFAKKTSIKGFRPGKAPLSNIKNYIKERYGTDIRNDPLRQDALNEVIQQSLSQAISEQKLTSIITRRVELKVSVPDQPLEYIAHIEILPNIGNIQFKLDNIEKLTVTVQDDDINRVLNHLCKQHANWQLVDHPVEEKNRVVIDYYEVNGENEKNEENQANEENGEKVDSHEKMEGFTLEIGSHLMIPGFEEGLIGAKAGDKKTLHLVYPSDFHNKEKAGKSVDFAIFVKQVFQADIPMIDEHFIVKLGITSGKKEDLITQIRQSLELECDRLVKEKIKMQVFHQLISLNPFDVPYSFVENECKRIHDEIYPPNQTHNHQEHTEQELTTFNNIATGRVMLHFLIAEYAKQSHLSIDRNRVEKRINEIAIAFDDPSKVIKWLLSDEQRPNIEAQVLEDQVIEKLLDGVPETIKTMSYAELKGIRI
jgi:trigger factor